MGDEFEVHHGLLQSQDNFGPAAGEGEAVEPTDRGRSTHTVSSAGARAGSAGADNRQATNRVQRKRRVADDELEKRIQLESLKGLEQNVTTEELNCQQRRHHQQKGVVPARSRDGYVHEAAAPRGGNDMADWGRAIWGRRIALWSGSRPLTPVLNFIIW